MTCPTCGGTTLAPCVGGAERGSCHCPKGPGKLVARLYYGTEQRPGGWNEYDVEFEGEIIKVDPPTLDNAMAVLTQRRAEWWNNQRGLSA